MSEEPKRWADFNAWFAELRRLAGWYAGEVDPAAWRLFWEDDLTPQEALDEEDGADE